MVETGIANLPLHNGKAPRWLFKRMVKLAQKISIVLLEEYGPEIFLCRLADPFWFQSLSCVLGYDWHSSGTTTVTCGAIKIALDPELMGIGMVGGKGSSARKSMHELESLAQVFDFSDLVVAQLKYASRMTAKIDNVAVQDGYTLYHHVLLCTNSQQWVVIQQGMNDENGYARRYHWLSDNVTQFMYEPHTTIISNEKQNYVLDMTAAKSQAVQKLTVDLVNDNPQHLIRDWQQMSIPQHQTTLDSWEKPLQLPKSFGLTMPQRINWEKMKEIYEFQPRNFEELLLFKGVGPATIRALALVSDLIYGIPPSWQDPVKYCFSVGGKDGIPYPVDKKAMDESTEILSSAILEAKLGQKEKLHAIKRLKAVTPPIPISD